MFFYSRSHFLMRMYLLQYIFPLVVHKKKEFLCTSLMKCKYRKMWEVKNFCTFTQLIGNLPHYVTCCTLVSSNLHHGLLCIFQQYLLTRECILVCCHIVFPELFQQLLPWQEEQLFPQWYMAFCVLLLFKKLQRKFLEFYH